MAVLTGQRHRARILAAQRPKKPAGRPPDLQRRAEALRLHAEGRTAKEIEALMDVGPSTLGKWVREAREALKEKSE